MGNAHEPRHAGDDAGFFSSRAAPSFIDAPPPPNQCPLPLIGCDPKSSAHAELWAHETEDLNGLDDVYTPALGGPIINNFSPTDHAWNKMWRDTAGLGFDVGDFVLAHGGQVALDIAGFVPGLNVATEFGQFLYHGAHAGYDRARGDSASAKHQAIEAGWHLVSTGANAFTWEGGNLTHAAHAAEEASRAKEIVHGAHTIVDAHEASWDLASSVVDDEEKLPFFPGIIPWIAKGAGRDGEHK